MLRIQNNKGMMGESMVKCLRWVARFLKWTNIRVFLKIVLTPSSCTSTCFLLRHKHAFCSETASVGSALWSLFPPGFPPYPTSDFSTVPFCTNATSSERLRSLPLSLNFLLSHYSYLHLNCLFKSLHLFIYFYFYIGCVGRKNHFFSTLLTSKGSCPTCIEANTVLPALEKNKAGSTAKETGGRAQISLLDPGSGEKFKGLGEFQTWNLISQVLCKSI